MPRKLGYLNAAGMALKRDLKRLLDPHNLVNILAYVFMWIVLAGFLVLPGSFPQIQTIVNKSGELRKVVQFMRNIPL
jgi:predicted metal-binding membrane protein